MLKTFYGKLFRQTVQLQLMGCERQLCSNVTNAVKSSPNLRTVETFDKTFNSVFDADQREAILKVINEGDVDTFRGHELAKFRAELLVKYREKNGPFHSLEDVLEVDNFGMKLLCRFCDSVVDEASTMKGIDPQKVRPRVDGHRWKLCDVSLPDNMKESVKSVVAVKFYQNIAAWSHVDRQRNVADWNYVSFDARNRVYDHVNNMSSAQEIFKQLPKADAYLFQRRVLDHTPITIGVSAVRILVQIEAVLLTMLPEDRLFAIETGDLHDFCDYKYGVEKPFSDLLPRIMNDERPTVSAAPSLRQRYLEWNTRTRALVAECVLRSVAFYETEVGLR